MPAFGVPISTRIVTGHLGEAPDDYYEITFAIADMPPVARDDTYSVRENTSLIVIAADGVLANDSVQDRDVLHAELVTTTLHGELVLHDDGSFVYTPYAIFNRDSQDSFQYQAWGGTGTSEVATVTIAVTTDYPWCNRGQILDVNDDGHYLAHRCPVRHQRTQCQRRYRLPDERPRPLAGPFLDVNRDGYVSPLDALWVINDLNGSGSGEGESPATIADAAAMSRTSLRSEIVANSEIYEPGSGDTGGKERSNGIEGGEVRSSTNFLQSLDLLFAQLDASQVTKSHEPVVSRRDRPPVTWKNSWTACSMALPTRRVCPAMLPSDPVGCLPRATSMGKRCL